MCGIAGVVDLSGRPDVLLILSGLVHRGPDGTAAISDGCVALGATRLALRDIDDGNQPMTVAARNASIVFNGEIYNEDALRTQLAARGHRFRTRCDTETMLRAWIEWGDRAFERIEGMFACALMDATGITLVRDRIGIKPLYYFDGGRNGPFLFASEAPALLRHPATRRALDPTALADFTALGHPTGTDTFFDGIKTLAPGHCLKIQVGARLQCRLHKWAPAAPEPSKASALGPDEIAQGLTCALERAVRSHLVADSPVAVALSGGLDSSALAVMAAACLGQPAPCFTVADELDHPDVIAARQISGSIAAPHLVTICDLQGYLSALPDTIRATGAPDAGPGPLFLHLCRAIGQDHKAALNGEGADEALGGYPVFHDPAGVVAALDSGFARAERAGLSPSDTAQATRARLTQTSGDPAAFHKCLREVYMDDHLVRCHLEPVDHVAMAASVEIRVPFMDPQVLWWSALACADPDPAIRTGQTKQALRDGLGMRFGATVQDAINRPKLQMPQAGRRLDRLFERHSKDILAAMPSGHADLAAQCFETDTERVVFGLFESLHLRDDATDIDLAEHMRSLIDEV